MEVLAWGRGAIFVHPGAKPTAVQRSREEAGPGKEAEHAQMEGDAASLLYTRDTDVGGKPREETSHMQQANLA